MSKSDDEARKLRDLSALRDEGVLTQAEFETSKARLLEASVDSDHGTTAVLEAPPGPFIDESEPDVQPATVSMPSVAGPTTRATKPLSTRTMVLLAIFTGGLGLPIYLWIKQRRRASAIVAAIVVVLFIAVGAGDSSSTTSSDDRPAKSASGDSRSGNSAAAKAKAAEQAAADQVAEEAVVKDAAAQAAKDKAAELAAAKQVAAEAAFKSRQVAAAAAKRKARITNAGFPDERTLALVLKDPDAHVGEVFRVWGEIMQFDSRTGPGEFLANVANRNTTSYGFFDGETALFSGNEAQLARFVQDDLLTAVVQVVGSYSYDTAVGGSNAVAQFKIIGGLQRQGSNAS